MLTRNLVNKVQQEEYHGKVQKVSHFESNCTGEKVKFYVNWVSKFYFSCKKDPGVDVTQNEIDEYLKNLSKHCEEWRVKQASDAIHLYLFHIRRGSVKTGWKNASADQAWKAASDVAAKNLMGVKSPLDQ